MAGRDAFRGSFCGNQRDEGRNGKDRPMKVRDRRIITCPAGLVSVCLGAACDNSSITAGAPDLAIAAPTTRLCGAPDAPPPGETIAVACARLVEARIAWDEGLSSIGLRLGRLDVASSVASCVGIAGLPGSRVTPGELEACRAQILLGCRGTVVTQPACIGWAWNLLSPLSSTPGTRAAGEACHADLQCASRHCVIDYLSPTYCGRCKNPRAVGEACDPVLDDCATTSTCEAGTCVATGKGSASNARPSSRSASPISTAASASPARGADRRVTPARCPTPALMDSFARRAGAPRFAGCPMGRCASTRRSIGAPVRAKTASACPSSRTSRPAATAPSIAAASICPATGEPTAASRPDTPGGAKPVSISARRLSPAPPTASPVHVRTLVIASICRRPASPARPGESAPGAPPARASRRR
jgi:hypothetical protein